MTDQYPTWGPYPELEESFRVGTKSLSNALASAALAAHDSYDTRPLVDQHWWESDRLAVEAFQRRQGLQIGNGMNEETWDALGEIAPTDAPLEPWKYKVGDRGSKVVLAQALMILAGKGDELGWRASPAWTETASTLADEFHSALTGEEVNT